MVKVVRFSAEKRLDFNDTTFSVCLVFLKSNKAVEIVSTFELDH